jgi:acetyl esterase/lipase
MKIIRINLTEDGRVHLIGYIQERSREMMAVAKKPAILIFPGGGYLFTSDREAEPIALAYAAQGFQAFILRYSVGKYANGYKPLSEASDAIGVIRSNAEDWDIIPDQIAVCGFSAGGHLAAWVGLKGKNRPNAMILSYPALEFPSEISAENPLVRSLIGSTGYTKEDIEALNLRNHVQADSIPMFCWHTVDDVLVDVSGIIRFIAEYAKNRRPFECHIFQKGEHGLSLSTAITANGRLSMVDTHAEKWFGMSVEWLYRNFGKPEIKDKPHEFILDIFPEK